eukprot:5527064-Amphidinium_carterae.1
MTHFAPESEKQARVSLGDTIGVLERWAYLAGVSLNSKSQIWSLNKQHTQRLRRNEVLQQYTSALHVRDLGADLTLAANREQIRTTQQSRVSMAIARSGKIRARPWSKSEHSLAVRFLVLSIANWGCELLMPTGKMVADLRVSVVRHFHAESFGRHPLMTL